MVNVKAEIQTSELLSVTFHEEHRYARWNIN